LGVDGAWEAEEGAWWRVRGAWEEGEAAWLRVDGTSNGAKRRMDDGVGMGSSGVAAIVAVAKGDIVEADRIRKKGNQSKVRVGREAGGGLRNSKRGGEIYRNAGEMRQQQQAIGVRSERAR